MMCFFPESEARNLHGKKEGFVSLALLMFGVPPFVNSLGNPHLGALHGADFVQLVACGFCAGLAFGVFIGGKFSRIATR